MKALLHAATGTLALACLLTFWIYTVVSHVEGSVASVYTVKIGILTAMWGFIPLMAFTGASGFALGRRRNSVLLNAKRRRMRIVAINGLVVLLPCAFVLASMARTFQFDTLFFALQGVELVAGALNITLLSLNLRDGLRLSGRLQQPAAPAP